MRWLIRIPNVFTVFVIIDKCDGCSFRCVIHSKKRRFTNENSSVVMVAIRGGGGGGSPWVFAFFK